MEAASGGVTDPPPTRHRQRQPIPEWAAGGGTQSATATTTYPPLSVFWFCTQSGHNQDMAPTGNRQDARARAEEAFRLRAVGRTWAEIAAQLGYRGRQSAQDAVRRYLERNAPESPEAARRSASEGLRITKSVLFAELAAAKQRGDSQGLVATAKAIADMIEKDARLNGLHAPQRTEVDVSVSTDPRAVIDRLETELLALVAQREPQTAIGGNVIDAEVEELPR